MNEIRQDTLLDSVLGANVAAAMQLLNTACTGKTIAVLLSDSGLKYLSTDLWP